MRDGLLLAVEDADVFVNTDRREQALDQIVRLAEDDLPALYSLADLFAMPSLYEGFGFPIVEAMACGCPVVTSNVSSIPEVAQDAAIFADPLSIEEIANAMKKGIEDETLRTRLIEQGYIRARAFNWHDTAMKTLDAFNRLKDIRA